MYQRLTVSVGRPTSSSVTFFLRAKDTRTRRRSARVSFQKCERREGKRDLLALHKKKKKKKRNTVIRCLRKASSRNPFFRRDSFYILAALSFVFISFYRKANAREKNKSTFFISIAFAYGRRKKSVASTSFVAIVCPSKAQPGKAFSFSTNGKIMFFQIYTYTDDPLCVSSIITNPLRDRSARRSHKYQNFSSRSLSRRIELNSKRFDSRASTFRRTDVT